MSSQFHIPRLSWNEFRGVVDVNSIYHACLKWGIYYSFNIFHTRNKVDFKVKIKVEESSWYKRGKETEDLLTHEYGHLMIAHLYGYKLKQKVSQHSFDSYKFEDVDSSISRIFDKTFKDCQNFQDLYDLETNHSLNKSIQERWNHYLDSLVDEYHSGNPNIINDEYHLSNSNIINDDYFHQPTCKF